MTFGIGARAGLRHRLSRCGSSVRRIATLLAFTACALPAQAAVLDISVGFGGGQLGDVTFDVRLDADLSGGDILPTTNGLTINSLSVVPSGGLAYRYNSAFDSVIFFGLSHDEIILGDETDFFVVITSIGTAPSIGAIADTWALIPNSVGQPTETTLSVTPVSAVPLPATAALLLVGLGGVAALKRRKTRAI